MSRIIFVTDSYGWKPTANGICVSEVAEYYRDRGHEVHVLSHRRRKEANDETVGRIHIHRIKMNPINHFRAVHEIYDCGKGKKRMALFTYKWINRLQNMIFLHWFPMHTPLYAYKYYRRLAKLHKQYDFDTVVASYAPFEAAGGAYLLKKKYPEIFGCLYILDSFSNLIPRFFLSKEWQDKKGWKMEQKLYAVYDLILNLRCHDKHYSQNRYDIFRTKMLSTDIPHITEALLPPRSGKDETNSFKTYMYAGLFRKITGNYCMQLFSAMAKEQCFELEVYTRSDISVTRQDISDELEEFLHWNGFVPREEILRRESEADALICLGNPQSDFITSKIFEMMLTGKKILHFYNIDGDPAISYLKRYPNTCFLDVRDSIDVNLKRLTDFMERPATEVQIEWLMETFAENTPSYTYALIEGQRLGVENDD